MPINYKEIMQGRQNRKTRLARPFENFFEISEKSIQAGEEILKNNIPENLKTLLERSIIISTVSSIEVYYRDMLELIFKYCAPSFFEHKLKKIHQEKYDITDVISIYKNKIHPLELITNNLSFQNTDQINKVFSSIIDQDLWSSVIQLQVRLKEDKEKIVTWNHQDFNGLKKIFELRHELVHNPGRDSFINEETIKYLGEATHMIFGSDVILSNLISENKDPAIELDQKKTY